MATLWGRRVATVRALLVVGALLQGVTWLLNVILFPSAVVTIGAALLAARRVGRDDDDAVLRAGVAVVTSLVAAVLAVFSGAFVFVAVAWGSSGLLVAAFVQGRRLGADRRRSWGIAQQDMLLRRRELERRRDTLRDTPRDGPPTD